MITYKLILKEKNDSTQSVRCQKTAQTRIQNIDQLASV